MRALSVGRHLIAVCSVAALTRCGQGQLATASIAESMQKQTERFSESYAHGSAWGAASKRAQSWMSPGATSADLLYVSQAQTVTVHTYPAGKLVGTLRHFYVATGMCVDRKGDIFVVDTGYYKIFEYAHGQKTRLATLQSATKDPVGCSVDPITGDLAVSSQGFGTPPTVAIYKKARGKGTTYGDPAFYQFYYCGYDDKGNLFVDGLSAPASGNFAFAELPHGGHELTNISLDQHIGFPGGVQWDGKHVAVGDQNKVVYEFSIAGSSGKLVGTTRLASGARHVRQFWIEGATLVAPNIWDDKGLRSNVLLFRYPAGGKATGQITAGIQDATGAVVSLGTK
jgi:hypothetical protein